MRSGLRKRGQSQGINVIITIALGLIVLAILAYWIMKSFFGLGTATSCESRGGRCSYNLEGCHPATEFQEFGAFCSESKPVCCVPIERRNADVDEARFTTDQRKALADPILLTQANNPQPVTSLTLQEGEETKAQLKFNDKLPWTGFGPTMVYLSDPKQPGNMIEPFYFEIKQEATPVFRAGTTNGLVTGFSGSTAPGDSLKLDLQPQLKHTYGDYTLNVIVLDRVKMICADFTHAGTEKFDEKKWNECLTNNGNLDGLPAATDSYLKELAPKYASDASYRLASKSYKITIKSNLALSGISTAWVADDTITVTSTDSDYSNLQFRLVNSKSMVGFDQIIDACISADGSSPGTKTDFASKLTNIIGTTTETNGIPLNLNIGGFRIPTATVQQKYIVEEKQIKLVNKKAEFKIDKATMLKDFYEKGGQDIDLITGENAYLCVRAQKTVNGQPVYAHAVALTPLKVDALPPLMTSDDVRIVYPDAIINTPNFTKSYPSVAGQQYFYKQYPQVVIACQDSGQSGCASYDYYLQTGNFINLNLNTDNIGAAALSTGITIGLNELFQYFAAKNPENTICPYLYSNEFRQNTRPTIQLRTASAGKEQGIICIRVKDRVGNAVLVWKEIYSPEAMLKKVAVEETNNAIDSAIA